MVGILTGGSLSHKVFLDALRELGYTNGRTVRIETRFHQSDRERASSLAAELVALNPAVILGSSVYGIGALKAATRTIPIVGVDLETDPVAAGFIASIARPGGNITGIFLDQPELNGKLLQLLKESMPRLTRVGVIWDENISEEQFRSARSAGSLLRLRVESLPVKKLEDIRPTVARAAGDRLGAVVVLTSPLMFIARTQLVELLLRYRLPSISAFDTFAEIGGLLAYGPEFAVMFRQAAEFVVRVLKGASPAEMPVERPAKFNLLVNLRTARALKLALPPGIRDRADRIIG